MPENLDDKKFVVLNLYDVVQLDQDVCEVLELKINGFVYSYLIIEQLKLSIISRVSINLERRFYVEIQKKLFNYGLDTWILKPGTQNWKKGKLKVELTVKFYPDELEEEIEENKVENYDNNNPEVLSGGEVIKIHGSTGKNLGLSLNFEDLYMIVFQLQKSIIRAADIKIKNRKDIKSQLFDNGLECNVLRPNTPGWQGGKLKVELPIKFYLDESLEEIEKNELDHSENQGENSGDNNSEVIATEPSPLDDLREKFNQENQ